LRVTIEYLPGGNEQFAQRIALVSIENESGLADVSDYAVRLDGARVAVVKRHLRGSGFWPLVERAMLAIHTALRAKRDSLAK
jgi:hypothetical protein